MFCLVSFIYIVMGIYALSLSFKNKINKVFFLVCVSANIWALSYSMAVVSDTVELALFFNRLSSLGWGTFYAFLLHFTKILVNKNKKISKKYYAFMYFPSFLIILFMGLLDSSKMQYNMVEGLWGYTSITPDTLMNQVFSFYTLVFAILQIINIIKWYREIDYVKLKKFIKVAIILSFCSIIFTFITDMIIIRIMHIDFMQLAVVWTLIPVFFIFIILIKSKRMHSAIKFNLNLILGNRSQEKIFQVTGFLYILICYAFYVFEYMKIMSHDSKNIVLVFLVIALGLSYLFMFKIFKSERVQSIFLILTYMASISGLVFGNSNKRFIIIWGLLFSYIVLSTILDKLIYSFIMMLFIVVIDFTYAHYFPVVEYTFTISDHVKRLIIICLFYAVILYVNKAYRKKDENSMRQIKYQELMSSIYSEIIGLNMYNAYDKLFTVLDIINRSFQSVNTFYIKLSKEKEVDIVYSVEGVKTHISHGYERTIFALNDEWLNTIYDNGEIMIFDIRRENFASRDLIKKFEDRGITGVFASPIYEDGDLKGITVSEFILNDENKFLYMYRKVFNNLILDAIKKIKTQKILYKKMNFDDITEFKNKLQFIREVNTILDRESDGEYYVVYVDVDDFKSINDAFGHMVGDEVLKQISLLLQEEGNENNLYSRISGDEFVIFCDKSYTKGDLEVYVEDILDSFKFGVSVNKNKFRLNASVGISKYPEDGQDIEILIKNAHIAMNRSKKVVSKRYHFCDSNDKKETLESIKYTDKLYNALDNAEFALYYQAQVCIEDNTLVGAEALLRWNSSEYGLVSPNKFIPILERTGMIVEVGEWVIEEAMKTVLRIEEMGLEPIRISVNLSVIQCLERDFLDKIESILNRYKIDPKYIEFEITESIAINDNNFVSEIFTKIKDMGFSIAIDDFGTGYSSLSRLQEMPLDRLKIDKSFVDGIEKDEKKEGVIRLIIEYAKLLKLYAIAEGVEEKYQVDYLDKIGCDEIQGYFYAKPMGMEDFERFIREKNK